MYFSKLLACSLLATAIGFAQESTPPATGGGPGAGTGGATAPTPGGNTGPLPGGTVGLPGNNPRNTNSPFPNERQTPDFNQMQNRPIYLSGKVRMEDGSVPPESVTIERVCMGRGNPVPEAYTDSRGGFGFQVGQRAGMMPDASISESDGSFGTRGIGGVNSGSGRNSSGVTERDLMSCELRASLPGYRSTIVSLVGRRTLDNPDVGTIILRRLGDVSGFTTSATSLMAPKDARKALEKARNSLKKNKIPDAQKDLEVAVNLHPKYAEAWYELGRVQAMQNNFDAAKASYTKALESDDKYVRPYLGLAVMEAGQKRWDEVKLLSEKVIKLNRYDFPAAFFYGAVANFNLRDNETAEKLCRSGIEIDQYHQLPKMSHLLGMILADKQDFKGASEHFNTYLKFAPTANDIEMVKQQLAEIAGRLTQTNP